ncbi:MAG: glycosyltransferase family 39 protein [Chloroflexi bacterium]|nr:glycosyltransferase family 39 protein [Chloroflexota bacterium]
MKKAEDFFSRRWFIYTALLLMIWAAFGLRLINIDAFSFWTDEALTPLRASYSVLQILRNDVVIQDVVTKDTHPPFYYLIIHVTRPLWGESDFSYRFPSVLAGVLLVPLLYQFGRRLRGKGLGMMAAMLTAVNPLQIWYANEARMYTLFVLLLAAASYVLWRALTGAPPGAFANLVPAFGGAGLLYSLHGRFHHSRPSAFLGGPAVAAWAEKNSSSAWA